MHFASPASPSQTAPTGYLQLPIQTLKAGALGTLNALGVAKKHTSIFMLASTSEVYGDPLEHPQREEYWGNVDPVGPRSVYDEAKRFAEAVTMAYHRTHKVDTRIVRIFNTYGPRTSSVRRCGVQHSLFTEMASKHEASAMWTIWLMGLYGCCTPGKAPLSIWVIRTN